MEGTCHLGDTPEGTAAPALPPLHPHVLRECGDVKTEFPWSGWPGRGWATTPLSPETSPWSLWIPELKARLSRPLTLSMRTLRPGCHVKEIRISGELGLAPALFLPTISLKFIKASSPSPAHARESGFHVSVLLADSHLSLRLTWA